MSISVSPPPSKSGYAGVYPAQVYANTDPQKKYRIQMYIPQIFGTLPVPGDLGTPGGQPGVVPVPGWGSGLPHLPSADGGWRGSSRSDWPHWSHRANRTARFGWCRRPHWPHRTGRNPRTNRAFGWTARSHGCYWSCGCHRSSGRAGYSGPPRCDRLDRSDWTHWNARTSRWTHRADWTHRGTWPPWCLLCAEADRSHYGGFALPRHAQSEQPPSASSAMGCRHRSVHPGRDPHHRRQYDPGHLLQHAA